MQKKRHIFLKLTIIFLLLFFLHGSFVKAAGEETSIVILKIKTEARDLWWDDFFEILDKQDYILLPVSEISRHLDLQIRYFREEDALFIEHVPSSRSARIDFKLGIYEGYPELSVQPPIQHEGDFFVSSSLIEHLTGAQINWNPRRQEVTIILDLDDEEFPREDQPETPEDPFRTVKLVPDTFGPDYSLGSFQYKISGISQRSPDGSWFFSSRQRFNLHGRFQNWALSLGLASTYNFTRSAFSLNIPLIRATYRDEGIRAIIGDSGINYPSTLGRTSLRGLHLQFPGSFSSKQFSYTTISGEAEQGSRVQLFVNGRPISSQVIGEEGVYLFKNVLLVTRRANEVRIIIEKPDGGVKELKKKIVGHPDILREGTSEISLSAGLQGRVDDYKGNILGGAFKYSIANNVSLDVEILRLQSLVDGEYQLPEVGSVIRLIGRPLGSTVLGLDWLVGGYAYDLAQGYRAYLLQGFNRGYLEGRYSYVEPKVTRTIKEIDGQRFVLTGRYDLTTKWGLRLTGDFRRSLPEMSFSTMDRGTVSVLYRDNRLGSLTLSLIGGTREFDVEGNGEDFIRVESNDLGFRIQHAKRTNAYSWGILLGYLAGQLSIEDGITRREDNLDSEVELSLSLTPSINITGNFEMDARFIEQELIGGKLRLEAASRWSITDNTFLSGSADSTLYFEETGLTEFEQGEASLGLNLMHFFSYDTVLSLGGAYIVYPYLDTSFYSARGSFSHYWGERRGRFNLNLGVRSPLTGRENFQVSTGTGLSWTFESGLTGEFEVKRSYQTMFDTEPVYSIELGFSQILGFGSGRLVGQTHPGSNQHVNFIGGLVFLDLNGNGIYDKGEPLLDDIPILLGGIRGATDKNGRFLFENLLTGNYEVKIDETLLPAEYTIVTRPKVVELRENENFFLEFAVTANGIISGRVFLDRNLSGTYDAGDEPMSFVGIYVENLDRVIYTKRDGTFYLENVPLGEHQLKVLGETLPAFTTAGERKEFSVKLTPQDLAVENFLIPIRYEF